MAVGAAAGIGWKLHASPRRRRWRLEAEPDATFAMTSRADSAIAVTRSPGKTEIALAHGSVSTSTRSMTRRACSSFMQATRTSRTWARSSRFCSTARMHVEVRVTEGEVKFARDGKEFAVTAKNGWTTENGKDDHTRAARCGECGCRGVG